MINISFGFFHGTGNWKKKFKYVRTYTENLMNALKYEQLIDYN